MMSRRDPVYRAPFSTKYTQLPLRTAIGSAFISSSIFLFSIYLHYLHFHSRHDYEDSMALVCVIGDGNLGELLRRYRGKRHEQVGMIPHCC
jgi:hypothetical protein